MEEIDKLIEKSEQLLGEATELAIKEIERIARKELNKNKDLEDFTMCMGSYFFSYKNQIEHDYKHYRTKELDDFIEKYSVLRLMGKPMTFTRNGNVITNW